MSRLTKALRDYRQKKTAHLQSHTGASEPALRNIADLRNLASDLFRKHDDASRPNLNEIAMMLKDMDAIRLNIKNFGYEMARSLQRSLTRAPAIGPVPHRISCRAATQSDVESEWFAHWCAGLGIPVTFHRKIWEFCFLLQTLHDAGALKPGAKALGFGCGEEPLPSWFASCGINVTVTDLDPEMVKGMGWAETGQHTNSLEKAWHPDLISREDFDRLVELRYVDMNAIPADLFGFDFCWSICALEHLGSIRAGLDFIRNSLSTVKSGGWAVHTTEFNYLSQDQTVDNWPTVLFRRKDFELIGSELEADGHFVAPMDFSVGDKPLDRFIDIPPYSFGEGFLSKEQWGTVGHSAHLKLSVDGHPSTCFGIAVRKK